MAIADQGQLPNNWQKWARSSASTPRDRWATGRSGDRRANLVLFASTVRCIIMGGLLCREEPGLRRPERSWKRTKMVSSQRAKTSVWPPLIQSPPAVIASWGQAQTRRARSSSGQRSKINLPRMADWIQVGSQKYQTPDQMPGAGGWKPAEGERWVYSVMHTANSSASARERLARTSSGRQYWNRTFAIAPLTKLVTLHRGGCGAVWLDHDHLLAVKSFRQRKWENSLVT